MVAGFASLPSRESSEEMVRLLREGNRPQEARFARLDVRIREQHLETQQVLHAPGESHRILTSELRNLTSVVQVMSGDIKALIAPYRCADPGPGRRQPSRIAAALRSRA